MKTLKKKVKIFKIKNRTGYAAVCFNHLTEGRSISQAFSRMLKALKRSRVISKETMNKVKWEFVREV